MVDIKWLFGVFFFNGCVIKQNKQTKKTANNNKKSSHYIFNIILLEISFLQATWLTFSLLMLLCSPPNYSVNFKRAQQSAGQKIKSF